MSDVVKDIGQYRKLGKQFAQESRRGSNTGKQFVRFLRLHGVKKYSEVSEFFRGFFLETAYIPKTRGHYEVRLTRKGEKLADYIVQYLNAIFVKQFPEGMFKATVEENGSNQRCRITTFGDNKGKLVVFLKWLNDQDYTNRWMRPQTDKVLRYFAEHGIVPTEVPETIEEPASLDTETIDTVGDDVSDALDLTFNIGEDTPEPKQEHFDILLTDGTVIKIPENKRAFLYALAV